MGLSVVLDFPGNTRRQRAWFRRLIDDAGAEHELHFIDAGRTFLSRSLAEWVAGESRCCPAVDFHVELPAFGALTLRLDGGVDVKEFIAAELGL